MKHIVVLTGAGISAESGVPTFRGAGGLWEGHSIEEVATAEGFERNPDLVHRFYNERRRRLLAGVQPNAAHFALARLEREFAGTVTVVTQNIDDLHERAGSQRLLHMHGELLKVRCSSCGRVCEWRGSTSVLTSCEACGRVGRIRPHVVWFGEMPFHMEEIERLLARADWFVAVGTSGHVYPAAGFVMLARAARARTLEINLEASEGTSLFEAHRRGRAGEMVPVWVEEILGAAGEAG